MPVPVPVETLVCREAEKYEDSVRHNQRQVEGYNYSRQ